MIDSQTTINAVCSEFKQNLVNFFENQDFTGEMDASSIGRICAGFREAASKACLKGLESVFDQSDVDTSEITVDGRKMINKGPSNREYLTPFGILSHERTLYQNARGGECVAPLDIMVGAHKDYAILPAREMILMASGHMGAKEVEDLFARTAMFSPKENAVARIVQRHGQAVAPIADKLPALVYEDTGGAPDGTRTVVFSMDAATMPMRESKIDGGKGHEVNHRNAMVGTVSFYSTGEDGPERIDHLSMANAPEPRFIKFRDRYDRLAGSVIDSLDPDVRIHVLMDGASSLWGYVNGSDLYKDCTKAIDFWHAAEHLEAAATNFFTTNEKRRREWFEGWRRKLRDDHGGVDAVIRAISYGLKSLKLSSNRRAAVMSELGYFKRNRKLMNYAELKEMGLPIGSGPVEAGCKTIVKQRMCRSGVRWKSPGAEIILSLRCQVKSHKWDHYWNVYKLHEANMQTVVKIKGNRIAA